MTQDMQPQELVAIFAANVKSRRKELGMSQLALAEKIGKYVPYVSDLESGKRSVRMETLTEIADALKTTPDALLREQQPTRKRAKAS